MKTLVKLISVVGLGLTIVPAFLVFFHKITLQNHYHLMLIGTIVWFVSAPFWMNKKRDHEAD